MTYPIPYATSHNGGKAQVNLSDPQTGGDYPYINVVKTSQNWAYTNGSTWPDPSTLDVNGYPTSYAFGATQVQGRCFIPNQDVNTVQYTVSWTGNGSVGVSGAISLAPGPGVTIGGGSICTSSLGSGSFTCVFNSNSINPVIQGTGVSNLVVCRSSLVAAHNAGEIWNPDFIAILQQGNFGVIRFLNSQYGNVTNVTTWATRRNKNYVMYAGGEFRPANYAGTTTGNGKTYTAAMSGFTLADKATVQVRFDTNQFAVTTGITGGTTTTFAMDTSGNAAGDAVFTVGDTDVYVGGVGNASGATGWTSLVGPYTVTAASAGSVTLSANSSSFTGSPALNSDTSNRSRNAILVHGNPTLNVNSTGAISIVGATAQSYINSGGVDSDLAIYGTGCPDSEGGWHTIATLVHDATLNAWIKQGASLYEGNSGMSPGFPLEDLVDLCAKVGAHPYFVSPPLACDPMTDWHSSLASYCSANGPSWMIPRFEGPNELWNTALGFYQTGYASAKATAYAAADPTNWTAGDYHNWMGKVMATIPQAIASAYGVSQSVAKAGTKFHTIGGVQTGIGNLVGNIDNFIPRLESTSYINQAAPAQSGYIKDAAKNWQTHTATTQYFTSDDYGSSTESTLATTWSTGNPTQQAAAIATYVAACASGPNNPANIASLAQIYLNWKNYLCVPHGITKMCGYEGGFSPDLGAGSPIDNFRVACKSSPDLGAFVTTNFNNYLALNDGSFTAEFPSLFELSGNPNVGNDAWSVLDDIYQTPQSSQWLAYVAFNAIVQAAAAISGALKLKLRLG